MAEKHLDPEDPYSLTGMVLPVSKQEAERAERDMAECFIEEYVMLGFSDDAILKLFKDPFYQATHAVHEAKGEEYVRGLIRAVRFGPEGENSEEASHV